MPGGWPSQTGGYEQMQAAADGTALPGMKRTLDGAQKGLDMAKYKTSLCKIFNSPGGCRFGDKCNFAHGPEELRSKGAVFGMSGYDDGSGMFGSDAAQAYGYGGADVAGPAMYGANAQKREADPTRFKTSLCKAFEQHGVCRYGEQCTFAHGAGELRAKGPMSFGMGSF